MAFCGMNRWGCLAAVLVPGLLSPVSAGEQKSAAKTKVVTNSIGMKLALIPAGKFVMGSSRSEPERKTAEFLHEVAITEPFHIGVYEVTQREYAKVFGGKRAAYFTKPRGGGLDHPVENILWKDAVAFCTRLSQLPAERRAGRTYRLPTEAEWEYACRAGSKTPFHFGASLSSKQANFNGIYPYGKAAKGPYLRKTAQVGSYKPNAFGLYDMHGNVSEWCADFYDKNYYRDSPEKNPLGPPEGVLPTGFGNYYLVVRGGCWLDDARACRSAYRFRAMPRNKYRLIGFRVVCEVKSKP
ncbi:MAG: formylglycine-generating enzyme family protein [Planctomycetes bacterium]|nr:formylglycine-generating enzyme family protein [Planctomycetota bacterium]